MTSKEEMLAFPHEDGITAYLTHGWNGWDSPGPVDSSDLKDLVASLESELDLVAFTDQVPQLRQYITEQFASPTGNLTESELKTLHSRSMANKNLQKTVKLSDFEPDEIKQLNATIQLDWELYRHFEGKPLPW